MSRYTSEEYQDFRERYPQLAAAIAATENPAELNKLARTLIHAMDADAPLPYPVREGALVALKEERKEMWSAGVAVNRSAADIRADRVLTSRDSSGKRTARKF